MRIQRQSKNREPTGLKETVSLMMWAALAIGALATGRSVFAAPCPNFGGVFNCNLVQGSSSVLISATDNELLVNDWSVEGEYQAYQEFPLYNRATGNITNDTLVSIDINADASQVVAQYRDPGVFNALATFTLIETANSSILEENFLITSESVDLLGFRAFVTTDFDLLDTLNDDQAVVSGGNLLTQTDGIVQGIAEVTGGPMPDAFQVALADDLYALFATMPNLDNSQIDIGPANYAQSFQWDFDLDGVDDAFEITVQKTLSAVPLPAAFYLFASGLIGLIGIARRKRVQLYTT